MADPLIHVDRLCKSYVGVHALADVSLDIRAGEVHALCGENGAGKSTLIKILSGVTRSDAGTVQLEGKPLPAGDVHATEDRGVIALHQESTVFPDLDAVDNLFVGCELRKWRGLLLNRAEMRRQTLALLERLGENIDPTRPVGELPMAQRQMVAMARALARRCRLLIMDEPTASLSARETQVLLQLVRQFRSQGVSVLYVSHRLEEVFQVADRVTVLRDGHHVDTRDIIDVDHAELIRMMVGREAAELVGRHHSKSAIGETVLQVRGLTRSDSFHDISFELRAGEVVGLAGLVGAGRSEVARALFGIDHYDSGTVTAAGQRLPVGDVAAAMKHGLALVPEDRQHEGLVLPMPVSSNLSLSVLSSLTRCGLVSRSRERELVQQQISALSIKTAGMEVAAETLSGGNQQKIVVGKWLASRPRVLILDEPTRGVDVAAKAQLHRLIRQLASEGMATLMISSELPEILSVSDRILVMREGQLAGELEGATATAEQVLALALPEEREVSVSS
ncbi:MAG: sugar ABC transporter ATP-binding protein [Planctomycetaceae bacterium]|nr:sugar ABC transporter ATP-binding protein [Planctomycetaceae bacterium]